MPRRSYRPIPVAALACLLAACASRPVAPAPGSPVAPAPRGAAPAAPADAAPLEARLARELPWDAVLRAVLERSPAVAAARARWEAALEAHPQAVSLPDPEVEFQVYTFNAMAPDGPQRVDTMARQSIPFPVTLALRGDRALREAEMERLRYDAALRDAVAEAREAWLEIGYLDQALVVLEEQERVLARYSAVAAGDLGPGRTKLPEEIRARALLARAGYDRVLVADLRRAEEQRLRSLLALPPDAALGPAGAADLRPLPGSLDQVLARAESRSQEIAMAGISLGMAGIDTSLARWEAAPEVTLGGVWMKDMTEDPTGRILNSRAVIVGLTVPLWIPAKTARIREADARERAAGAERAEAVERVRAAATRLWFRAVNAERLALLYRTTLVPQADRSLVAAEGLYREGKGSLGGALEAATARQDLLLALHRAEADRGQAVSRLEQTVGATLTPPPEPEAR